MPRNRDERLMGSEEFVDAMLSPGRLLDHPAVQRVLRAHGRADLLQPPKLTVIKGGRDAC